MKNEVIYSTWKISRLPGNIKMQTRQRFIPLRDPLLIEEIVLESMPLELEQPERLMRRR